MNLRHTLFALGILASLAIARDSLAQGPGGPPPMAAQPSPEQELKRLDKKLKLS